MEECLCTHEYLGIPYAKLNEDNPFGPAIPHPGFDEVFDAYDDSAICPQREEFNHTSKVGTLDCLYRNVHVPSSVNSTSRLPVFVWIYGGSLDYSFFGRHVYGVKFLVRHGIIVLSLNYRINVYGFMCLDTPEVPGNQGLKDQLLALRWIRENIEAFGGDPDKITIAGNSAGGISVEYLIMHQKEGPRLFHKAIMRSGTTLVVNPDNSVKDALILMAQQLGYQTSTISEAIAFLAKEDPHSVIATMYVLNLNFDACIEKQFEGEEAIITENWSLISELPGAKDMPVLFGFTKEEALVASLMEINSPAFVNFVLSSKFDTRHEDFQSLVESVRHFYFGDKDFDNDVLQAAIEFASDVLINHSTLRSVARFLDNDVGNMYLYIFSYDGGRNYLKLNENITVGGASHADEIGYLFDVSYMEEPSPEDYRVIDYMTAMWANFVKYGDPTPQTTQLLPRKWLPITKGSPYHYMNIDLTLSVGARPLHERMTFWDLIFEAYGHLELATRTPNDEL